MRRLLTTTLIFLGLAILTLAVWAQEPEPALPAGSVLVAAEDLPELMMRGEWEPIKVDVVESSAAASTSLAAPAADSCNVATPLNLIVGGGDGGVTIVTAAGIGEDADDPAFSCAWGGPQAGYRTVWYKLLAPSNGHVRIQTLGSNYDTILSVGTGGCGSQWVPLACSDDRQGFSSEVTFTVVKGQTYYVEVADWHETPPSGGGTLSVAAWMDPINSKWDQVTVSGTPAISRHAAVTAGDDIYVIGGQTVLGGSPTVSSKLYRLETDTGKWVEPTTMIGPQYSNTTAAHIDGRIYLPAGYTGNNTAFDGTHWVYDIAGRYWDKEEPAAPWPNGKPIAMSAAVEHPSAIAAENGYYLTGGMSVFQPDPLQYLIHRDTFFYAPSSGWTTLNQLNTARYAHAAGLVNGTVCVAGGDGGGGPIASTECLVGSNWITNTATLNFPRSHAGSGVSPDGKWLIYGGRDKDGRAVSVVEMYDPATPRWQVLDVESDLGGTAGWPARAWPRGGFVGNMLYAVGGNNLPESNPLPIVNKLFVPSVQLMLPVVAKGYSAGAVITDDTFDTAQVLLLNQPKLQRFNDIHDLYDVFTFELTQPAGVLATLTQVPSDSNYDLMLYDALKWNWGAGRKLAGESETIDIPRLAAGRYYLVVERVSPKGDPNQADYKILVKSY